MEACAPPLAEGGVLETVEEREKTVAEGGLAVAHHLSRCLDDRLSRDTHHRASAAPRLSIARLVNSIAPQLLPSLDTLSDSHCDKVSFAAFEMS